MRFRLRTLLIVVALAPLLLVALYVIWEEWHIQWLEDNDLEAFKKLGPHPPAPNP
jgi:hypothetical protein